MSTIDEVLAAAEVVDAVCVIDGETRIISVPAEYKELGVESDEKVTRVKFQCPKNVGDNIDLTEYNLYINYRNAGNKLNSYLVEDVTVTGDTINFSWLLSRHVTESPGTISYIVCAKKSDDTGVINEWNTKVATGIVGIGLETTEEIEEQNIDAIEQILRSIVELENKASDGGSGEVGGYYAPAVDADGNLSWTASKADMPAVDGTNIKGPQGKSAYAYAVEGGYTGTEAEFAAKLAEEMPDRLPNPNALTFSGAVTGSYDGSAPLSVEIPSGGGGGSSVSANIEKVYSWTADGTVQSNLDSLAIEPKKIYFCELIVPSDSSLSAGSVTTPDVYVRIGTSGNTYTGCIVGVIKGQQKYIALLSKYTFFVDSGNIHIILDRIASSQNVPTISNYTEDKVYIYSNTSGTAILNGTTVNIYKMG